MLFDFKLFLQRWGQYVWKLDKIYKFINAADDYASLNYLFNFFLWWGRCFKSIQAL